MDRNSHRNVQLITLTSVDRVFENVDVKQQVAGRAPPNPHVALATNPDARAIGDARGNANGQGLRSRLNPLPVARAAFLLFQSPGASAGLAVLGEHHVSADGSHGPAPFAGHAAGFGDALEPAAVADPAGVLSSDGHGALHAVPRLFEGE